ncbi:phosphoribosyl-dephospho-CoA transferase, partial [Salmonella enterica]|nr:phosphoribosyl-dephospho-CoA transferase [Salmonella enterica]
MSTTLRPHDLIWLNARDALEDVTESWVDTVWHSGLPVVVRRDVDAQGRVPVGVRG